MKRTAHSLGKILMIGFVMRFEQKPLAVKRMIDEGTIGKIYFVKAGYLRRCGNPGGWFANRSLSGGGPMIDLGVHLIDCGLYLMGNPEVRMVCGKAYKNAYPEGCTKLGGTHCRQAGGKEEESVEDYSCAFMTFENGEGMFVETSWNQHVEQDTLYLDIFGEKGGIRVEPSVGLFACHGGTLSNTLPLLDPGEADEFAFCREINHFIGCVRGDTECLSTAQDGVKVMRIIDAHISVSRCRAMD